MSMRQPERPILEPTRPMRERVGKFLRSDSVFRCRDVIPVRAHPNRLYAEWCEACAQVLRRVQSLIGHLALFKIQYYSNIFSNYFNHIIRQRPYSPGKSFVVNRSNLVNHYIARLMQVCCSPLEMNP